MCKACMDFPFSQCSTSDLVANVWKYDTEDSTELYFIKEGARKYFACSYTCLERFDKLTRSRVADDFGSPTFHDPR